MGRDEAKARHMPRWPGEKPRAKRSLRDHSCFGFWDFCSEVGTRSRARVLLNGEEVTATGVNKFTAPQDLQKTYRPMNSSAV